jgi:enamine deaminase RidA (YjgF/YER057c/UK114 family)
MPPAFRGASAKLRFSPGVVSGSHVFLSGQTGSALDGQMPRDPSTQFRNAFDKIGLVLGEVGLSMDAIVEMTTYHVGLREHFELFDSIRLEYLTEPYPAWTAVEVAGLRREGALVEIRVIASAESES